MLIELCTLLQKCAAPTRIVTLCLFTCSLCPPCACVQDTADQYLRDRRLPPVMQAVIGGKFAQQIICRGVPYRSEKEEEFYQVLLIQA